MKTDAPQSVGFQKLRKLLRHIMGLDEITDLVDADVTSIIDLPHHVSATRPQMSMMDRAAQFSPFAALTGYDAAIKETGRLTDQKVEMDAEALNVLNMKFQILIDCLAEEPEVTFTYFKSDERKDGGAYIDVTGIVKKVDDFERLIVMQSGTKIPMDDVLEIEGDIFSSLE